jgi:hypothetical protein
MTIGQIIDTKEKDIEIQRGYKWEMSKNPAKKDLKPDSSWKLEAVRLNGIENIWHQVVMSRYDFSDFTQNVRLILEDKGQSFTIFTDDVSVFANAYGSLVDHGSKEILISMSKILEQKSTLFELSKFMIFLPNYFTQNEEKIIIERHPTQLIKYLKEGEDKEFEQLVDNKKLIRYRNVYSFVNSTKIYPDIIISKAPGLKIEMTGFWKKLNPNQIGINKKGEPIHGKTWVEQKLTWLETDEEEVVKLYGKHGKDILSGENEGVIYVMRCAAHSKDIFKIGLTKRSSEIRSSELERTTGSPDKFLVVEEWYVSDCYRAEKEIHEKLVRFRFNPNREFFQAPYDILRKELYEIIEKYKKNYPN